MTRKNLLAALAALVLLVPAVGAQNLTDDPGNNIKGVHPGPVGEGGLGTVIGSFTSAVSATNVGLEDDGTGDLLSTEITGAQFYTQTVGGSLVSGPFAAAGNPIGITTNGSNLFFTDTVGDLVHEVTPTGTPVNTFPVAAQTTFPEGITFNPFTGNLYVVNGSGGNLVHEYTTAGTLVQSFPVNGSSQDGIAWDPQRCSYWIYDSGTDTVTHYDDTFTFRESFAGTGANGFANGEGLAVVGNSLFVVAPTTDVVEFDIDSAMGPIPGSPCEVVLGPVAPEVPMASTFGLIALALLLAGGAFLVLRRRA